MDADSETKIVTKLLQMIAEDSSGDVKGMAVKWYKLKPRSADLHTHSLAPLSTKVSEKTFGAIIDGPHGLSKNIFATKKDMEETKDISTIGLKFIIAEVPDSATTAVTLILSRLSPKLIEQIQVRVHSWSSSNALFRKTQPRIPSGIAWISLTTCWGSGEERWLTSKGASRSSKLPSCPISTRITRERERRPLVVSVT